jgi:hypothetical protein
MSKVSKDMRKLVRDLPKKVAREAANPVLAAAEAGYPDDHVRTGAARQAFESKSSGATIRVKCGVHKKKSKSGKRRKSRSGKVNYAQFIPNLWNEAAINNAITEVVNAL